MKKILLNVVGLVALIVPAVAQQQYVHQVIFLNEGQYDYTNEVQLTPVSIGSYDPVGETYNEFDVINDARFASDVIVDEAHIYVAADTLVILYDKNTLQRMNSVTVHGVRKLAFWNDQLLVTRGDVTPFTSYFQVFDKSTLAFEYELDVNNGPAYASSGIQVYNDTAYVAINNGFEWGNYVGKVGIIDLNAESYAAEVDLGPDAINPDNLMIDGGKLYTLNNKNFDGSSVTTYDATTRASLTANVAINSSCGTSVRANDDIYYMEYSVNKVARFNTTTQQVTDTIQNSYPYYGMANDDINGIIYATNTDYVTYGEAFILDYNGTRLDSFMVGVSPGNIALDVRTSVGAEENNFSSLSIYPNPANDVLNISGLQGIENGTINITDLAGRVVYSQTLSSTANNMQVNIESLSKGVYMLTIDSDQSITKKIVKR